MINGMQEPLSLDSSEILINVFGGDDEEEVGMLQKDLTPVIEAQLPAPKIQTREVDITGRRVELARGLALTLPPYLSDIANPEFQKYYRSAGLTCNFFL